MLLKHTPPIDRYLCQTFCYSKGFYKKSFLNEITKNTGFDGVKYLSFD